MSCLLVFPYWSALCEACRLCLFTWDHQGGPVRVKGKFFCLCTEICYLGAKADEVISKSSAINLLARRFISVWGCMSFVHPCSYPLPPTWSHCRIGSVYIRKRRGERVSPCMVPLSTGMDPVCSWGWLYFCTGFHVEIFYRIYGICWEPKVIHNPEQFVMVCCVKCRCEIYYEWLHMSCLKSLASSKAILTFCIWWMQSFCFRKPVCIKLNCTQQSCTAR